MPSNLPSEIVATQKILELMSEYTRQTLIEHHVAKDDPLKPHHYASYGIVGLPCRVVMGTMVQEGKNTGIMMLETEDGASDLLGLLRRGLKKWNLPKGAPVVLGAVCGGSGKMPKSL